jgi:hypothetical protein
MNLPRHIWADYDPKATKAVQWAFYRTLEEQRANRPDLWPIQLVVKRACILPSGKPISNGPRQPRAIKRGDRSAKRGTVG